MHLTVSRPTEGEIVTVGVAGELDVASRQPLIEAFSRLHDEGHDHVLVDLRDLTFIDSSGISALITGLHTAEERGGWLRIANANGAPLRAMELTGVTALLSEPWRHTGPSWSVDGLPAAHSHDDPPVEPHHHEAG